MKTDFFNKLALTVKNCQQGDSDPDCNTFLPKVDASSASLQNILAIVFAVIAVVAVIIIMLAGLQMITAQGSPEKISKARQTIIFAGVGLAIALSGELIVQVVIGRL